jgi:hypothetical protein
MEDVALDDGRVIAVDRSVVFQESNSLSGDAYSSTELKSTLAFHGELETLPTWDVAVVPLVLYHDALTNEWVIVATSNTCEVFWAHGNPSPPYWEYRAKSGGWQEVPLQETSFGRESNLFILYEKGVPDQKLTLAVKQGLMEGKGVGARYKMIDRNAKSKCAAVAS